MMTRYERLTALATFALFLVAAGPAMAKPSGGGSAAFSQVFCGGWAASTTEANGLSPILGLDSLRAPNSSGEAFSDTCGGTTDGTYQWSVNHGQVNSTTQHGTEHGTFHVTFTSGTLSGNTLGAIFDGQIFVFNGAALALCTGVDATSATTVIYETAGNFNTLKNNSALTGTTSSFHEQGTYVATVTQDGSNNCHFNSALTGN